MNFNRIINNKVQMNTEFFKKMWAELSLEIEINKNRNWARKARIRKINIDKDSKLACKKNVKNIVETSLDKFSIVSDLCPNKGHENVVWWFPGRPNLRQTYVWCSRWGICGLFFLSILSDLPPFIETDTPQKSRAILKNLNYSKLYTPSTINI